MFFKGETDCSSGPTLVGCHSPRSRDTSQANAATSWRRSRQPPPCLCASFHRQPTGRFSQLTMGPVRWAGALQLCSLERPGQASLRPFTPHTHLGQRLLSFPADACSGFLFPVAGVVDARCGEAVDLFGSYTITHRPKNRTP